MEYITIKDGIITGHFCGGRPTTEAIEVEKFEGQVGDDVRKFNPDWTLRPLDELVAEGLLEIPRGFKYSDGGFVELSRVERMEAGLDEIPRGRKIVAGELVEMSDEEQFEAGQITAGELLERRRRPLERELVALDERAVRPLRAILAGTGTDEDTAKLKAIEAEAVEVRARLAEIQG